MVSVRRVWLALSQSYTWKALFRQAYQNLTAIDTG
jgi:hypothetical protein